MKTEEVYEKIWAACFEYFEKDHDKTAQTIRNMGIVKILHDFSSVIIESQRPGILIGPKGKLIEKIGDQFPDHDLKIFESQEESIAEAIISHFCDDIDIEYLYEDMENL